MTRRMFVPIVMDASNLNAQVNNARQILAYWNDPQWQVQAMAYHPPDPRVAANPRVKITRLWRWRAWTLHMWLTYLRRWDLVFYPGVYPHDAAGLRWRRRLGLHAPVVSTVEGLIGDAQRESGYSVLAGHPVYCQPVSAETMARIDWCNREARHIIAISPFLARMARSRYGDKVSYLPLGINPEWFHDSGRSTRQRLHVVAAGTMNEHKRPELLLQLALALPDCDFTWYGEGPVRASLQQKARAAGAENLHLPGPLPPEQLGAAFRAADIFVLPSRSEGVPKVTQEAAACGLAQVIFGFYEAPSVVDGVNGHVVWNDEQFIARVGELCADRSRIKTFGSAGAEMARGWDWRILAPQWQQRILEMAG